MRKLRNWLLIVGACLLAGAPRVALAGGGGGGGSLCAGFSSSDEIIMRDNCFQGAAQFADTGTVLTVQNNGQAPHSYTAVDGSFDTGLLESGQSAEITAGGSAGIVLVYCTLHGTAAGEGMSGVLLVGEPTPQANGNTSLTRQLSDELASRDQALFDSLDAQAQALSQMQAELAAVKAGVSASASARPLQTSAIGLAGLLLGGAATAVVVRRKSEA